MKNEMFIYRPRVADRRFSPVADQLARSFPGRVGGCLECDYPRPSICRAKQREHENCTIRKPCDFAENVLYFHLDLGNEPDRQRRDYQAYSGMALHGLKMNRLFRINTGLKPGVCSHRDDKLFQQFYRAGKPLKRLRLC